MSDALPARGQCLLCRCTASTFPPFPETLSYTCEHDYTSHTLILRDNPSDPYNSMRRGTNVHHQCGGFVKFDEDRLFNAGKKIAHPTRKDLVILPIAPLHANLTASIIPRSLSPETAQPTGPPIDVSLGALISRVNDHT
ncbi:hypothetical protein C8R47DRAFT_1081375 [Mycena vitilis]|nr:hypothetical protein C8R47DRAFT_1081375 [Mycena vitilis]